MTLDPACNLFCTNLCVLLSYPLSLVETGAAYLSLRCFDRLDMMCIYSSLIGSLFRRFVGFVIVFRLDLSSDWSLHKLVVKRCLELVHVLGLLDIVG